MSTVKLERRKLPRIRCSDPIWWRQLATDAHLMGWLLETSADGAAFIIRTSTTPRVGRLIQLNRTDPEIRRSRPRHAVIRRIEEIHDDLILVAVQFVARRPPVKPRAFDAQIEPREQITIVPSAAMSSLIRRAAHVGHEATARAA